MAGTPAMPYRICPAAVNRRALAGYRRGIAGCFGRCNVASRTVLRRMALDNTGATPKRNAGWMNSANAINRPCRALSECLLRCQMIVLQASAVHSTHGAATLNATTIKQMLVEAGDLSSRRKIGSLMIDSPGWQDLKRLPERSVRPLHSYPGFLSRVNNDGFPCVSTQWPRRGVQPSSIPLSIGL